MVKKAKELLLEDTCDNCRYNLHRRYSEDMCGGDKAKGNYCEHWEPKGE